MQISLLLKQFSVISLLTVRLNKILITRDVLQIEVEIILDFKLINVGS